MRTDCSCVEMITDLLPFTGFLCVKVCPLESVAAPSGPQLAGFLSSCAFTNSPFAAPAPRSRPLLLTHSAPANAADEPLIYRWSTSCSLIKPQHFLYSASHQLYPFWILTFSLPCFKLDVYTVNLLFGPIWVHELQTISVCKNTRCSIFIYYSWGYCKTPSIHSQPPFLHMLTLIFIYNALTSCNSEKVLSFPDSTFLMLMWWCPDVLVCLSAPLCTNTQINPLHVSLPANAGACYAKQGNSPSEWLPALPLCLHFNFSVTYLFLLPYRLLPAVSFLLMLSIVFLFN